MAYKLFYAPGSAAMGTRVIPEEIGAPYELIQTTIAMDEPRPPEQLALIPKELIIDSFDGIKSVRSGRRGAQRDAVHLASAGTHQMDGFGPPRANFSRPLDCVMLHLWSTRPPGEACLASKREKLVKWVNNQFLWYYPKRLGPDPHLG